VESLIAEASSTIETLLCHTQDSAAVSNSAIERIQRVQGAIDHIAKSLIQLDDITIGNRLLAVNARIQAVYAGDRAAGFGGVANEIGVQAKRSAEIVELIRSVSSELRNIANSALVDLQSMVVADQKAYRKSKLEVDRVLENFRYVHNSTREFIGKMQEESRSVAIEISGAVRNLQFQDRINQRISHVVAELDRIKSDLSAHCGRRAVLEVAAAGARNRSEVRSEIVKTALIVDDSTTMRQMVAFTLREAGFEVVEAEHGQDALNKLPGKGINIVITDLNMPVMDGFTFIKNVRAMSALKFVPIPNTHHRVAAF
jgi:CheY-like chemotaxis protein